MLFRQQATNLVGKSIQVQMSNGRALTGHLSLVGTDFLTMRVRIGRRIRNVFIRLAEILFLFALL